MRTINHIKNEKGVALMMVLFIATVGLSVTATMLYMILVSTQSSGIHKRFRTALEAGTGAETIVTNYIQERGNIDTFASYISAFSLNVALSDSCVTRKLNYDTTSWPADCDKGRVIDVKDPVTYDMVFTLGNYEIYSKIINTKAGNTSSAGGAGGLVSGGVTHVVATGATGTGSGNISTTPIPYLYTIVVEARNKVIKTGVTDENQWRSARDKARIYILYEF